MDCADHWSVRDLCLLVIIKLVFNFNINGLARRWLYHVLEVVFFYFIKNAINKNPTSIKLQTAMSNNNGFLIVLIYLFLRTICL